jgi:hypothetical protein
MISHAEFGRLRLRGFLPPDSLAALQDWEFEERLWVGEALGFSEWLCLEEDPNVLRSLAIAFDDFPTTAAARVLETIGLPLAKGMTIDALRNILGEPHRKFVFVKDRVTYEFRPSRDRPYNISCTVLNDGGLVYLVVMTPVESWPARTQ